MRRGLVLFLLAAGSSVFAGSAASSPDAPSYVMHDLGSLGGQPRDWGEANAINRRGQVVGWSTTTDGKRHAFLWRNGKMADLGTLGGRYGRWSIATALNDRGQVVGWSAGGPFQENDLTGTMHAFLWQAGKMTDLGTLGGRQSKATTINEIGQIVGWSTTRRGDIHAFLWQKGTMTDLGAVAAFAVSRTVFAVTGTAGAFARYFDGMAGTQAFFKAGGRHELLTLKGTTPVVWEKRITIDTDDHQMSSAIAINARGQLVGSDGHGRLFRWDNGTFSWGVGLLAGAEGINDRGQIVGGSLFDGPNGHAALWEADHHITDLGTRVKDPTGDSWAAAINDQGKIVGKSDGHPILWTRR